MPFRRSSRGARWGAGDAGVTLVEVLLVLIVGSLVLAMMGSVYVIVQGTFYAHSKKVTAQQEATVLADFLDRQVRRASSCFVYEVPNTTVPADSGDGLAIFDADGYPLQRFEYDPVQHTVVDSTGARVTAVAVHDLQFRRDPLLPLRVHYRFAADDEHGNLVDMVSAVSARN